METLSEGRRLIEPRPALLVTGIEFGDGM